MKRLLLVLATAMLVLYKPLSTSGATGSSTATTVALGGSYYLLQANGTLSSTAQTSISLENGEGAILVEEQTDGPDIPDIAGASTVAASASSVSQGSSSPTSAELLGSESFERLLPGLFAPNATGVGLQADQGDASAELDQFLALCVVQNLTACDARSNGPASNWPTQSGQSPMTAAVAPPGLWLGSLRPSKASSNNSSFDESTSPADEAVAGSSSVDDPAAPSSAN